MCANEKTTVSRPRAGKKRSDHFQTRFRNAFHHLAQNPNLDPYPLPLQQDSLQPAFIDEALRSLVSRVSPQPPGG
jgi:hypothetical protein